MAKPRLPIRSVAADVGRPRRELREHDKCPLRIFGAPSPRRAARAPFGVTRAAALPLEGQLRAQAFRAQVFARGCSGAPKAVRLLLQCQKYHHCHRCCAAPTSARSSRRGLGLTLRRADQFTFRAAGAAPSALRRGHCAASAAPSALTLGAGPSVLRRGRRAARATPSALRRWSCAAGVEASAPRRPWQTAAGNYAKGLRGACKRVVAANGAAVKG